MIRKFSPKAIRWLDYKYSLLVHVKPPSQLTIKPHLINPYFSEIWYSTPGGGTWAFFGWVCAARDSKLPPRSKTISLTIDTPFLKWANFLYPILEFALKLIPHSILEMGQFFILRSRVQEVYNGLLVNASNRIFKSNLSLNTFKWLLTKVEL